MVKNRDLRIYFQNASWSLYFVGAVAWLSSLAPMGAATAAMFLEVLAVTATLAAAAFYVLERRDAEKAADAGFQAKWKVV